MKTNPVGPAALMLGALLLASLSGCYASGVSQHWGVATRNYRDAQIVNPKAPETLERPTGLDPATGEDVMAKYHSQASAPAPYGGPSIVQIDANGAR